MKAYVGDFNNILMGVKAKVNMTQEVRDADVIILWQDVRGSLAEIAKINKDYIGKPLIVVQHGRGACRDYGYPNNFPLIADKICVWGQMEADRMKSFGYGKDRVVVTGSPLLERVRLVEKQPHKETYVVYTPVITSHEESENVDLYYELKKIELEKAQETLRHHKNQLKEEWNSWVIDPECATDGRIHYDLIRRNFFLICKLIRAHDVSLYHGVNVVTNPFNVGHVDDILKLFEVTDCVIGWEEGTFHLMASFLDIPTVIVDGFKYGSYGGVSNYSVDLIKTEASTWTSFKDIKKSIYSELENPTARSEARKKVVEDEFAPFGAEDSPIERIIDLASELAGGDIRKKEELVHGNC